MLVIVSGYGLAGGPTSLQKVCLTSEKPGEVKLLKRSKLLPFYGIGKGTVHTSHLYPVVVEKGGGD